MQGKRRFFFFLTSALLTATAACTLLLDRDNVQCSSNGDCAKFSATATCVESVCVMPDGAVVQTDSGNNNDGNVSQIDSSTTDTGTDAGNIPDARFGFDGCFEGTPTTADQFLNACTKATCLPFDDCAHLGICDGGFPGTSPPPPPGPATTQPDSGATQFCSQVAAEKGVTGKTVVVSGSSNFPPFLTTFAPVLFTKTGYSIIWQTTNSCAGVDVIHNQYLPDGGTPSKQFIRESKNRGSTLFYNADGTTTPCFLDGDTPVDVGESDIFAQSCTGNIGYDAFSVGAGAGNVGEFFGPILPMVFVVSSGSSQRVLSAAAGQAIFGNGSVPDAGVNSLPYNDPNRLFIRASSTATNQMMSRAISVDPTKWWGLDKSTATNMANEMRSVPPNLAEKTIGIISADFADDERPNGSVGNFRALAFQAHNQGCGFFPDSNEFTFDKKNVRDGHYPIWGPLHFFAKLPISSAAQAFVTTVSATQLDEKLLTSIVQSSLIPTCAMRVTRDVELGAIRARKPNERANVCDCFFDKVASNRKDTEDSFDLDGNKCQKCTSAQQCPSSRPACNYGFCEPTPF